MAHTNNINPELMRKDDPYYHPEVLEFFGIRHRPEFGSETWNQLSPDDQVSSSVFLPKYQQQQYEKQLDHQKAEQERRQQIIQHYKETETKALSTLSKDFKHGTYGNGFNTDLGKYESVFQKWFQELHKNALTDKNLAKLLAENTEDNYDWRAFFMQQGLWKNQWINPATGELPDVYKKPTHPTFTKGSLYAQDGAYVDDHGKKYTDHDPVAIMMKNKAGDRLPDGTYLTAKEVKEREESDKNWLQKMFSTKSEREASWAEKVLGGSDAGLTAHGITHKMAEDYRYQYKHPDLRSNITKLAEKYHKSPIQIAKEEEVKQAVRNNGLGVADAYKGVLKVGVAEMILGVAAIGNMLKNLATGKGAFEVENDGGLGTDIHNFLEFIKRNDMSEEAYSHAGTMNKLTYNTLKYVPAIILNCLTGSASGFAVGGAEKAVMIAAEGVAKKSITSAIGKAGMAVAKHLFNPAAAGIDAFMAASSTTQTIDKIYAELTGDAPLDDATSQIKEHMKHDINAYGWAHLALNFGTMRVFGQAEQFHNVISAISGKIGTHAASNFITRTMEEALMKTGAVGKIGLGGVMAGAEQVAGSMLKSGGTMALIQGLPTFLDPIIREHTLGTPHVSIKEAFKQAADETKMGFWQGVFMSGLGHATGLGRDVLGMRGLKAASEAEARFNVGEVAAGERGHQWFEEDQGPKNTAKADFRQRTIALQNTIDIKHGMEYFNDHPELRVLATKIASEKSPYQAVQKLLKNEPEVVADKDREQFVNLVRSIKSQQLLEKMHMMPAGWQDTCEKIYGIQKGLQDSSDFSKSYKSTKYASELINESNYEYYQELDATLSKIEIVQQNPHLKEVMTSLLLQKESLSQALGATIEEYHDQNLQAITEMDPETGEPKFLVDQQKVEAMDKTIERNERMEKLRGGKQGALDVQLGREIGRWEKDKDDGKIYEYGITKQILKNAERLLESERVDPGDFHKLTRLAELLEKDFKETKQVRAKEQIRDARNARGEHPEDGPMHEHHDMQREEKKQHLKQATEIIKEYVDEEGQTISIDQTVVHDVIYDHIEQYKAEEPQLYEHLEHELIPAFVDLNNPLLKEGHSSDGSIVIRQAEEGGFEVIIEGQEPELAQTLEEAIWEFENAITDRYQQLHNPMVTTQDIGEALKPDAQEAEVGDVVKVKPTPEYTFTVEQTKKDTTMVQQLTDSGHGWAQAMSKGYQGGVHVKDNETDHNKPYLTIPDKGSFKFHWVGTSGYKYSQAETVAGTAFAELMAMKHDERIAKYEEMKKSPGFQEELIANLAVSYNAGGGRDPMFLLKPTTPEEFAGKIKLVDAIVYNDGHPPVKLHRLFQHYNKWIDEKPQETLLNNPRNLELLKKVKYHLEPAEGNKIMFVYDESDGKAKFMIHSRKVGQDPDKTFGEHKSYAVSIALVLTKLLQLGKDFTIYPESDAGWDSAVNFQMKTTKPMSALSYVTAFAKNIRATEADVKLWNGQVKPTQDENGKDNTPDFTALKQQYFAWDLAKNTAYFMNDVNEYGEKVYDYNADEIAQKIAATLEYKNISIDFERLNDHLPSFSVGDNTYLESRTLQENYIHNGILKTDVNLVVPYTDSSVFFEVMDNETPSGQINIAQDAPSVPLIVPEAPASVPLPELTIEKPDYEIPPAVGDPIFVKNGGEMHNIPNSYIYNSIIQAVAHNVADHYINSNGADLKALVYEFLTKVDDVPGEDLDRAMEYRNDLKRNLDQTVAEVKKLLRSYEGIDIAERDVLGDSISRIQEGASIDPYANSSKRLIAVMSTLQGDYDSETTVNKISSVKSTKDALMNILGGKIFSKDDLFRVLEESNHPIAKEFLQKIQADADLATSAYCTFSKQKMIYHNVSYGPTGEVYLDSAAEQENRNTASRWRREILNMSADPERLRLAILAFEDLKSRAKFTSFDEAANWMSAMVKTVGADVNPFMWKRVAETYYEQIGHQHPEIEALFNHEDNTMGLIRCMEMALNDPSFIVSLGYESPSLLGHTRGITAEVQKVLASTAAKTGVVPSTPVLNRIALFTQEFSDTPSLFVINSEGKKIYLYQERNYFDRFINEYLTNPEYIANKLKDPLYEGSHYLREIQNNPDAKLEYSEVGDYQAPKSNVKKPVGDMTAKDVTMFRFSMSDRPDNYVVLPQVSEKDRIMLMRVPFNIPQEYMQNPASYLSQTFAKGEIKSVVSAHKARANFLNATDKNWDSLNKTQQQELLGDRALRDYGLIKGIHWKYDSNGVIVLDGSGYKASMFPFLTDNAKSFADLEGTELNNAILAFVKEESTLRNVQIEVNRSIRAWVKHLGDNGLIKIDYSKMNVESQGLEAIVGASDILPMDGKMASENTEIGTIISRERADAKVTQDDQKRWEDGFTALAWKIASEPEFADFREQYGIEEKDKDTVNEILQEEGLDMKTKGGSLSNMSAVQEFISTYGKSPSDKYMPDERTMQVRGAVYSTALKQMFNSIEMGRLIFGDQSLYGSREVQTKRISGEMSTGTQPSPDLGEVRVLNVKDVNNNGSGAFDKMVMERVGTLEHPSKLLSMKLQAKPNVSPETIYKNAIKEAKEELGGMMKQMITDGQCFITPDFARKLMIAKGSWGSEQQRAYEAYKTGGTGWEGTTLFPTMKWTAWSPQDTDKGFSFKTYDTFYKTSLKPLSIFDEHQNEAVRDLIKYCEENNIHIIAPDSSVKIGGNEQTGMLGEKPEKIDKFITTIDPNNIREQFPIEPHETGLRKMGIQAQKVLFSNTRPEYQAEMHTILGKIQQETLKKLSKNIIASGASMDDAGLTNALSYNISLDILPTEMTSKAFFKALGQSVMTMMNGNGVVLNSAVGLKNPLLFRDENGFGELAINKGQLAQILPKSLSNNAHQLIFEKMKADLGTIQSLGYRVPSQGKPSLSAYSIREIYSDVNGDSAMTSNEEMGQKGWDYDIDKLYQVLPSFGFDAIDAKDFKLNDRLTNKFNKMAEGSENNINFDKESAAYTFAMENKCVYKDGNFYKFGGSFEKFIESIHFKYIDSESLFGLTNQYIKTAGKVLTDTTYSLDSTITIDGPVKHVKSVIKEYSPMPTVSGLASHGPAYLTTERDIAKGGGETIGAYALKQSMKAIIEEATAGSPVLWALGNEQEYVPRIAIEGRDGITNKTGGMINNDLTAWASITLDASKDPIAYYSNINKVTADWHGTLLVEGHGDNAGLYINQYGLREFANADERKIEKVAESVVDGTFYQGFDLAKLIKTANKDINCMDGNLLKKNALLYKKYQEEGTPKDEWSKDFIMFQLSCLAQVPVLQKATTKLNTLYVLNNLDKGIGSSFSDFHRVVSGVADMANLPGGTYYKDKMDALQSVIEHERLVHPFLVGYNVIKAADIVFPQLANQWNASDRNLVHRHMVKTMYAIGFQKLGVNVEGLIRGPDTLKTQYEELVLSGALTPSMPLYRYIHTGNPKKGADGEFETLGTVWLDVADIKKHELEQDVTDAIADAYAKGGRVKEFINNWVMFAYVADGGQMPELFPPEVLEKHPHLSDVADMYLLDSNQLPALIAAETMASTAHLGKYKITTPKNRADDGSFYEKTTDTSPRIIKEQHGAVCAIATEVLDDGRVKFVPYKSGESVGARNIIHYADEAYQKAFIDTSGDVPEAYDDVMVYDMLTDPDLVPGSEHGVNINDASLMPEDFFTKKMSIRALEQTTKLLLSGDRVDIPREIPMTKPVWRALEGIFAKHGIEGVNKSGVTTFEYMPGVDTGGHEHLTKAQRKQIQEYAKQANIIKRAIQARDINTLGQELDIDQRNFLGSIIKSQDELKYVAENLAPVVSLLTMTDHRPFRIVRQLGGNPEAVVNMMMKNIEHPVVKRIINIRLGEMADDIWLDDIRTDHKRSIVEHLIYCTV